MNFSYDLCGAEPVIKDLIFNEQVDADGNTLVYDGMLVKVTDFDDIDKGKFVCNANTTTLNENVCGILCEQVAASGATYLPFTVSATGTWTRKKILVNPNAVFMIEYARKDRAGTACTDTGFAFSAAATVSTTSPDCGTSDTMNGSWLYFLDGSNAGYLHNVLDSATSATAGVAVLRTAIVNAVLAADTELVIQPALDYSFDMNVTYTDVKSEWILASRDNRFVGIDFWIQAPGIPLQKLDASKHDGLKIDNARFFHEVMINNHYFGAATQA